MTLALRVKRRRPKQARLLSACMQRNLAAKPGSVEMVRSMTYIGTDGSAATALRTLRRLHA
jgi:hypothetical protein